MTRSKRRKLEKSRSARPALPMLGASIIPAVIAAMSNAQAQEQGEFLDEVIVTAQKRQESLQDVPLSMAVLGTQQLENLNVTRFDDFVKFLPSVTYQSLGPGASAVYFRGVASGENSNHSGPVPSVGIYLDEQPITTIQGALDIRVYDMERIEALAGPQGTLYGASSQSGTIRYISNKPDPSKFAAGYDLDVATIDHGSESYSGQGFVNIPLSDNMAIRLVGWAAQDGGYIDNVLLERTFPSWGGTIDNAALVKSDYNKLETYGGRAALKIDLNDSWTITPQIMGQQQKTEGSFVVTRDDPGYTFSNFKPVGSKDEWWQAALTVEGKIGNLDLVYSGAYLDRQVLSDNEYNDYSYFYDVQYGYGAYWYDNDYNPINPSQYFLGNDQFTKMSHEIRLSSSKENRVYFVAGLFYQEQEHLIEQNYKIDGIADFMHVDGWPDTIWLTQQTRKDTDSAIFGEVTWNITDKLSATGGIRFFEAESSLKGFFGFSDFYSGSGRNGETLCSAILGNPRFDETGWVPFRGAPCTNLDESTKENGNTPKVNLTYRLTDSKMIYATYSEGFRPGGVNRFTTVPPYSPDYLKNYEVGWKTMWADGRFRFNGAIFQLDWDDIQFSYLGENGLTVIRNAGKAQIRGFEGDISWAVANGLNVSAGWAYIDSELREGYCEDAGNPESCPPFQAPAGTRLPVTPEWKGNLIARWNFPMGSFDSFVQGAAVYNGEAWSDLRDGDREVMGKQDAYTIVDFAAGLGRGSWRAELYLDNAFDERAELFATTQAAILGPEGNPLSGNRQYIFTNQPRTLGLRFSQRF